jgi:hypothetical protein
MKNNLILALKFLKKWTIYSFIFGAIVFIFSLLSGSGGTSGTYVEGSIDRRGHYRKGHFRKSHSTHPDAYKHRMNSRIYYHYKGGKYRRKKQND